MAPSIIQFVVLLVILAVLAAVGYGVFYLVRTLVRLNRHVTQSQERVHRRMTSNRHNL